MATIVTRTGKGSALTWTEGDANITNLNNAKIENVVEDTTPQLGGNLDVNGNSIISLSNADINITPDGTGKVVTTKQLNASILGSTQSSGDEGGQLELAIAATNTTLSGGVAIDINQNRLRIFETGGSNRGAYIDLSAAATGVGTNLVGGGGASTLDGLTDVVLGTPATGEVLYYDGTNWIDTPASGLTVSAASTATTATGATNIDINTITGNTSDTTMYPVFVGALSTGNQLPHIDSGISYNASTNALTATTFAGALSGTATNSTNAAITNNSASSATWYPTFVAAISGNNALTVNSSGLAFTPSTGTLTAIAFSGAINGTVGATTPTTGRFTTTSVTAANDLRLYNTANTFYVGFKAGTVAANKIWTLPSADGTANQVLKTDGAGVLGWATAGGGGNNIIMISTGTYRIAMPTTADAATTSTFTLENNGGVSGVSVSTSTFTLPAGTYIMEVPFSTSTSTTQYSDLIFRNTTDSTSPFTIFGSTISNGTSNYYRMSGMYYFTIAASKTFTFWSVDAVGAAWYMNVGTKNNPSGTGMRWCLKINKIA